MGDVISTPIADPCPSCGRPNDSASGYSVPADGDIAICFGCHALAVFEGGKQRTPTDDDLAALYADPEVRATLIALRAGGGWGDSIPEP